MIVIDVLGTPAPKGSNRAINVGGRARFVPGGSPTNQRNLRGWDASVREQALLVCGERAAPVWSDTPLAVEIVFRMARPGSHWGKGRNAGKLTPSARRFPSTAPDADKLARSTLDSLTGLVFDDDSRIVQLVVRKEYAQPGREGARITVGEAT